VECAECATPAPLTEAEAQRWFDLEYNAWQRDEEDQRSVRTLAAGIICRASRGDIPPDVRAVKDGGGQAFIRVERSTAAPAHTDGDACPSCSEVLGSPSVCAISHDFRPGAYDGATVTTTPGHTWRRDASGGPTLVPVRPSARPVLDQVYAIVRPFYETDEHAEGRPAASWVLEQVREAITPPVDVPHDLREAAMARWATPVAPVATVEPWMPKVGDRVVTVDRLTTARFPEARREGATGMVTGAYTSCGGFWVRHDDGTEAPYDADELAPEVKP
jgi:hypothetical protein